MSATTEKPSATTEKPAQVTDVRPFRVEIPEADIEDLRRRIAATRWPTSELVEDSSQGVQLTMLRELARYWATDYDFGRVAARLNALPQFTTEIDGVGIHFVHVRSRHENALPLLITHGWPGSVLELLAVIAPLTDPTAYGGTADDAFDVVLPSLPGYGFSGQPAEIGWDSGRIAGAWAELMRRLGYNRYVAQGGDQGAGVTDAMGRLAPEGLVGAPLQLPGRGPARAPDGRAEHQARLLRRRACAAQQGPGYLQAGLHQRDGRAPADDRVLTARFPARSGGLDAGPRRGQLREDLPRIPRRGDGRRPHPGQRPRQHHPVLVDRDRCLDVAALLGDRTGLDRRLEAATAARLAPRGLHRVPRANSSKRRGTG